MLIGVSGPGLLDPEDIATMAEGAIVFALANPDPEVDPIAAAQHAAVVATGDLPEVEARTEVDVRGMRVQEVDAAVTIALEGDGLVRSKD